MNKDHRDFAPLVGLDHEQAVARLSRSRAKERVEPFTLVGRVGQGGEGIVDIGQTDERR